MFKNLTRGKELTIKNSSTNNTKPHILWWFFVFYEKTTIKLLSFAK